MNDFCGKVDGIILGQCKCSGFHIYGDGLKQGVRMITLDENEPRKLETKMHYYRDYFGVKCNSIKGLNLFHDRWHTNFKFTVAVLGSISFIGAIIYSLIKFN